MAVAQLESLGQIHAMRLLAKIWDFVFGAMVIGAAPVIAFEAVGLGLWRAADAIFGNPGPPYDRSHMALGFLSFVIDSASALTALFFACRWRMKRRPSMFWAEAFVGLAVCGAYFMVLSFIWAMSDPNW